MAQTPAPPGNGFAVAALLLGIVGVITAVVPILLPILYILAPPWGILALIFGIVGRRRSTRTGAPRRGMATAGIALGAIAAALLIAGAVFVIQTSSEELRSRALEDTSTISSGSGLGPRSDGPFGTGQQVTLEEAQANAGFPVRIPRDPLANPASLTTVWYEDLGPEMNHVALEFSSRVEIILTPTPDGVEPFSYLSSVAELGPPAALVMIHGVPAAVYPANTVWERADATSWTEEEASVHVDLEGVNYSIYGAHPTDDLIRIAASLPAKNVRIPFPQVVRPEGFEPPTF